MLRILLVLLLSLGLQTAVNAIELEAYSLRRLDMPDKFPYQVNDEGFAVVRINLRNDTDQAWTLRVEDLEVCNKKGKAFERARPPQITSKIIKYYTGIIGYDGDPEETPMAEVMAQQKGYGPRVGAPMVSLDTVEGLRKTLEYYEIADTELAPGESLEAFYYLKSKNSGRKLTDGFVRLKGERYPLRLTN